MHFLKALLLILTMGLTHLTSAQDWAQLDYYYTQNDSLAQTENNGQRIIFYGNSITEGWKSWRPNFFSHPDYINRGIGGQTTPQMLIRFRQDVVDLQPRKVIILAGINDIAGNTGSSTLQMIMDNLAGMCEIAQANNIQVVLCSVLPAYDFPWRRRLEPAEKVVELNKMIKQYATDHNHDYVDYFSSMVNSLKGLKDELGYDGVHPNEAGYEVMESIIMPYLKN